MIRLSYSTLEILNDCERRFEIERLLKTQPGEGEETAFMVKGTAYGAGMATYLLTQDMDKALYQTWLHYLPKLESVDVTEDRTMFAILTSQEFFDKILQDWEVATFNNKPAIELSFRINIDEEFYYVGYIDVVLKKKKENYFATLEAKTTRAWREDLTPAYQNSSQGLGYSIILDEIVGEDCNSWNTNYLVYRETKDPLNPDLYFFPFRKTLLDRLRWFYALALDVERIKRMKETGIFPMRGSSCITKYNKVCGHFGLCHLHSMDSPKEPEEDTKTYDFTFHLQDVINSHIRRITDVA